VVVSFIAAEKADYPVAVMCRALGVNRTSFHDCERRPPSDRALTDAGLTEKIKRIHEATRGVYGGPRIHAGCGSSTGSGSGASASSG
jgi:putative transposase